MNESKGVIDEGHQNLIQDIKFLLDLAEQKEFHDFANEMYATPKIQLVKFLEGIVKNVKDGRYDN